MINVKKGYSMEKEVLTPIKAIRAKCMDCSCESFIEVRECNVTDCPLYPYRMGHRPKKNVSGSEVKNDE